MLFITNKFSSNIELLQRPFVERYSKTLSKVLNEKFGICEKLTQKGDAFTKRGANYALEGRSFNICIENLFLLIQGFGLYIEILPRSMKENFADKMFSCGIVYRIFYTICECFQHFLCTKL